MLKLREISTPINFTTYVKEELVDIKIGLSELKFIFEKKALTVLGAPYINRAFPISTGFRSL